MGKPICAQCDQPALARGLCRRHYGRAYRRRELISSQPMLPIDRHSIQGIDRQTSVGHCSICGPGTRIQIRPGRSAECWNRRKELDVQRRPRRNRIGRSREANLISKYGIDQAAYDAMLKSQGGVCAICHEAVEYVLKVDHCHETGRVRGLLCHPCNVGLGWFRDDAARVRRAADYLGP